LDERIRQAILLFRTGLETAENRFHRVKGYRELPLLITALGNAVYNKEAVA